MRPYISSPDISSQRLWSWVVLNIDFMDCFFAATSKYCAPNTNALSSSNLPHIGSTALCRYCWKRFLFHKQTSEYASIAIASESRVRHLYVVTYDITQKPLRHWNCEPAYCLSFVRSRNTSSWNSRWLVSCAGNRFRQSCGLVDDCVRSHGVLLEVLYPCYHWVRLQCSA